MISETLSRWCDRSNDSHEHTIPVLLSITLISLICLYFKIIKSSNKKVSLPPGPRGLPIVGSLPFLDRNLHTYFAKLATTYGPIFKIQLGSRVCIVLSSASLVDEVRKFHDINLSNHDAPAVGLAGIYGGVDILWAPYGEHWRMLRKLCVQELFCDGRLEALYGLRRTKVRDMVNHIYSEAGQPIHIRKYALITLYHLLTDMLWGGTLEKKDKDRVSLEFVKVVDEFVKLLGGPNISDLFPILAKFDIQGLERKMKKVTLWLDDILSFVIDQRLSKQSAGNMNSNSTAPSDFLQVLLQFKDQGGQKTPFTITHIKALFVDMLVAGTKTSATSIEWVMAELMKNQQIMRKVQEEIDEVVGINNIVEECHLPKLKYLNAVQKEVMRLHPIGPLLIPRRPSESCTVGGYMIPKGTKVFVNAWAIHRDPECWDNPLEFKPERFLNPGNKFDFNGTSSSFLPFGFGRRICVGIPLAERTTQHLLASLLHSFNWKLPNAIDLDLSESFALEMTKTIPLFVIPTPRLSEPKLYT